MATVDIWAYREQSYGGQDLVGYSVEALDGGIGKIDESSNDVGSSFLVVDTVWIFGKKVMLPAGVVSRVDEGTKRCSSIGRRIRSRTHRSLTSSNTAMTPIEVSWEPITVRSARVVGILQPRSVALGKSSRASAATLRPTSAR